MKSGNYTSPPTNTMSNTPTVKPVASEDQISKKVRPTVEPGLTVTVRQLCMLQFLVRRFPFPLTAERGTAVELLGVSLKC